MPRRPLPAARSAERWDWLNAVRDSNLPPSTRSVLLAIGLRLNGEGRAWPGYPTIVSDTGLSRSTVIRHVRLAQGLGWLRKLGREAPNGRTRSNAYEPMLPEPSTEFSTDEGGRVSPRHPGVSPRHPRGVTTTPTEGVTATPLEVLQQKKRADGRASRGARPPRDDPEQLPIPAFTLELVDALRSGDRDRFEELSATMPKRRFPCEQ